jgi:outer membrane receptor protein involved in Fe transport
MPRSQLNVGAAYHVPLSDALTLKARVDYLRTGTISFQDFQNNADPNHYLFQPSYSTVDAQLAIEGQHWAFTTFGRNLTGQHYATSAYSRYIAAFIFVPLGVDLIQKDPGRIYGAEVRYRF